MYSKELETNKARVNNIDITINDKVYRSALKK
jgi:hypothetical protein